MYAYVEALKNSDADVMRSLVTGTVKEQFEESVPGEAPPKVEFGRVRNETETPDEVVEEMANEQLKQHLFEPLREMYSRTEVVGGEYVGDEFHFQLRMPALEIPEIPDVEIDFSSPPKPTDTFLKMRKENGAWRIYELTHGH